jgi:hypothetical protein
MPFVALIIGAIIVVVAFNNSASGLATELETDIPGFFKWGAAIAAILALGYIPGVRTPSRWLLGLVLIVILLKNYQQIFSGLTTFASSGASATASGASSVAANPTAAYVATNAPAAASATPTATTATTAASTASAAQVALSPLNPNFYSSMIGFGGVA